MKVNAKKLKQYSDSFAIKEVLGSFMKKPVLMKEYIVVKADFPEPYHKLIFATINNLYKNGAEVIDAVAIDEYLSKFDKHYRVFEGNDGLAFVQDVEEIAQPLNIKYYHERLRKFTMLRAFVSKGQDVSYYFDPKEIDSVTLESQAVNLGRDGLLQIKNYYKGEHLEATASFTMGEGRDSKKAGVGGVEQLEKWKKFTAWGKGYASAYLTTALYGLRKRRFTVKSAGTGVGKTRTTISDIANAGAPALFDKITNQWYKNPNGTNGILYIGTEMELLEEIDPILWAYMADVPQDKIEFATYTEEEEKRIVEAIRILSEEGNIWLEYLPTYDSEQLSDVVEEHVLEHNVECVFFDYIHTTTELLSEFAKQSVVKMSVREDQVLANLSNKLKGICRRNEVSLDTCTQVSGDFKNEANRDSTIVRGAKSIIDKADCALIAMPPTEMEKKKLEPILAVFNRDQLGNDMPMPNLCYSLYKNRGGKLNNIRIWLYINYDTMRTNDLFVTDDNYNLLKDIPKTYINILEDEEALNKMGELQPYEKPIVEDDLKNIY